MARERSRPALLSKQAPAHSAFTSHGWPWVCVHTESSADDENRWPVSPVCCAINAQVSASVKSPMRSDYFAATLKVAAAGDDLPRTRPDAVVADVAHPA